MMSENKCPCCKADMSKVSRGKAETWHVCNNRECLFTCRSSDLDRLDAAMELAIDFAACNENRGLTPRIVVRAREVFGEAKG